jgi:hypothetical protein
MDWHEIQRSWSEGWRSLQADGLRRFGASVRTNPEAFRPAVARFIAELEKARINIQAMPARFAEPFQQRYNDLAAGLYTDVHATKDPSVSGWILIVGGIAVGILAIVWAVVAWEYARNLREETDLARHELDARVDASREGRALPPSTLPAPIERTPPAKEAGKTVGWLLLGGLAVAAAALAVPVLLKR